MSPRRAAQLAAVTGIRIHTVGVGREPARQLADGGGRTIRPSSGLDEATLADVARITGGDTFRAADTEGLRAVYRRIDATRTCGAGRRAVPPGQRALLLSAHRRRTAAAGSDDLHPSHERFPRQRYKNHERHASRAHRNGCTMMEALADFHFLRPLWLSRAAGRAAPVVARAAGP